MSLQNNSYFINLNQHFPRIALAIEARWGTKDLEPYIVELIKDTRNHTRQGFPETIFESLYEILNLHGVEFPDLKISPNDVWSINYLK